MYILLYSSTGQRINVVTYFRIQVTAMFLSLSFVRARSTFTNEHTIKLMQLISFLTQYHLVKFLKAIEKLALSHFIALADTEFTDWLNYSGWVTVLFVRSLTDLYHNSLHVSSVQIVHSNILQVTINLYLLILYTNVYDTLFTVTVTEIT